jgi:hypothetical protein
VFFKIGNNKNIILVSKRRDTFRNSRKKMRALRGRGRFLQKKSIILEKVIFSQEK